MGLELSERVALVTGASKGISAFNTAGIALSTSSGSIQSRHRAGLIIIGLLSGCGAFFNS